MNNGKIQVQIQANIDINSVRKQLESLNNTKINIGSKTGKLQLLDLKEIDLYQQKMKNAIEKLQIGKQKIFTNENIQKELRSLTKDINNFGSTGAKSAKEINLQMSQFRTSVSKVGFETKQLNKETHSYFSNLGMITKKFADWIIVGNLVMGVMRQFQNATTYIIEMDTAINGIAKVTTFSTKRLLEMKDAAIQMGKELGHSSIDIMKAQAEFARVVKDPQSINDLTKTAIVASNVTTMTAEEAAKAINLTRISFKMSAEDSMKILDMWNEIQNNFRVSGQDLAEGVAKTGSVAKQAGVPLEKLLGYITAISSATGISGNESGTALKSMISRTFRVGEEGVGDPGRVEEKLADPSIGIAIKKNATEFKAFDDILKDISVKWKEWSTQSDGMSKKMAVADAVAGTYHISKFTAMMDAFSIATEASTTALNSQGSAMKEQAVFAQTLEGKMGTLKATLESMYDNLLKSTLFSDFLTNLTIAIKTFGNMESILTVLTTALIVFYRTGIVDATVAFGKYIGALIGTITTQGLATASTNLLTGAFQKLKAVSLSSWLGIIATGIAVVAGSMMFATAKAEENRKQALKDIETKQSQQQELDKLIRKYETLYAKYQTDKSLKGDLIIVEGNLKDAIGETSTALDLQNGKIETNIAQLRKLSREKAGSDFNSLKSGYDSASRFLTSAIGVNSLRPEDELKRLIDVRNSQNKMYDRGEIWGIDPRTKTNEQIAELEEQIKTSRDIFNKGNILKSIADGTYKFPEPIVETDKVKTAAEIAAEEEALRLAREAKEKALRLAREAKEKESPYRSEFNTPDKFLQQDKYKDLNDTIDGVNEQLELNDNLNRLTNDDKEKQRLLEERTTLLTQQQKALSNLANGKRSGIQSNIGKLNDYGFSVDYDSQNNKLQINNLEHINELKGKDVEETNNIRKEVEDLISDTLNLNKSVKEYGNQWWVAKQGIADVSSSIYDMQMKMKEANKEKLDKQLKLVEDFEKDVQDLIKKGVDLKKESLDKELDDYKEFIDEKIKAKDEEYAAEDYERELQKEFKDRQETQNQINSLMFDSSLTGKKKRKELEQKKADQTEKIEELQRNRRRDLEKKSLQTSLDNKEKNIDKAKELIDEEWTQEKINIEARNSIVNKSFANLSSKFPQLFDKLNTGTNGFFEQFSKYQTTFGEQTLTMAQNFKDNVLPQLQEALRYTQQLNNSTNSNWNTSGVSAGSMKNGVSYPSENPSDYGWGNGSYGGASSESDYWNSLIKRDNGGILPSGVSAVNMSGRDEYVMKPDVTQAMLGIFDKLPSIGNIFDRVFSNSIPNTSNITGANNSSLNLSIVVNGNADGGVVSSIRQAGNDIVSNLKKELNKRGVYR